MVVLTLIIVLIGIKKVVWLYFLYIIMTNYAEIDKNLSMKGVGKGRMKV